MQQAARISDDTAFFLNGVLVEHSETKEMFTSPKDKKTEDYIQEDLVKILSYYNYKLNKRGINMLNTNLSLSIDDLKQYTINMIDKCDRILDLSVECMLKKDIEGCKKVINQDDKIDELREYIRDRSIELFALKQPMAKDLRYHICTRMYSDRIRAHR